MEMLDERLNGRIRIEEEIFVKGANKSTDVKSVIERALIGKQGRNKLISCSKDCNRKSAWPTACDLMCCNATPFWWGHKKDISD